MLVRYLVLAGCRFDSIWLGATVFATEFSIEAVLAMHWSCWADVLVDAIPRLIRCSCILIEKEKNGMGFSSEKTCIWVSALDGLFHFSLLFFSLPYFSFRFWWIVLSSAGLGTLEYTVHLFHCSTSVLQIFFSISDSSSRLWQSQKYSCHEIMSNNLCSDCRSFSSCSNRRWLTPAFSASDP